MPLSEQGNRCTSNPVCEGPGSRPTPTSALHPWRGRRLCPPPPQRRDRLPQSAPAGAAGPSLSPPGSQPCVISAQASPPSGWAPPTRPPRVLQPCPEGCPAGLTPRPVPTVGVAAAMQCAPPHPHAGPPADLLPRERLPGRPPWRVFVFSNKGSVLCPRGCPDCHPTAARPAEHGSGGCTLPRGPRASQGVPPQGGLEA